MADPKLVEILSEGLKAWKNWSSRNPHVYRDFRAANLIGRNLKGVSLYPSDFLYAKLKGADLEGANLGQANLWFADLRKANLRLERLLSGAFRLCWLALGNSGWFVPGHQRTSSLTP